jgi:transcriptional regulator with XRE-family HTH domain
MENIKLTVRALAAQMGIGIEELADQCGISYGHLKQVSAGNVAMTAYDLKKLSEVTGVPIANIYVKDFDD